MNIPSTLKKFSCIVDKRFDIYGLKFSTEDNIRYDFFYALLHENKIKPWDILLESSYPLDLLDSKKKSYEIDLLVKPINIEEQGLICEFKYDKKINTNINKTNRYGKLLNDLLRLYTFKSNNPNYHCLLVYICDDEMLKYKKAFYNTESSKLKYHFDRYTLNQLNESTRSQIIDTFYNSFVNNDVVCRTELIFEHSSKNKKNNYTIYVWEINTINKQINHQIEKYT